jgi:predicted DNA-binding transcriptional regulator AlpA
MTATTTEYRDPVRLGIKELDEILPGVTIGTIYRWNSDEIEGRRRKLPRPRYTSGAPSWSEAEILAFAEQESVRVDTKALARVRKRWNDRSQAPKNGKSRH